MDSLSAKRFAYEKTPPRALQKQKRSRHTQGPPLEDALDAVDINPPNCEFWRAMLRIDEPGVIGQVQRLHARNRFIAQVERLHARQQQYMAQQDMAQLRACVRELMTSMIQLLDADVLEGRQTDMEKAVEGSLGNEMGDD